MANPSSVGVAEDYDPAILEATTTPASVTLDGSKQYYLQHNGIGEDAVVHTGYIMFATGSATAAATTGAGQGILVYGQPMIIGPGITTLTLDASADDPTVTITPSDNFCGVY